MIPMSVERRKEERKGQRKRELINETGHILSERRKRSTETGRNWYQENQGNKMDLGKNSQVSNTIKNSSVRMENVLCVYIYILLHFILSLRRKECTLEIF